MAYQWYCRRYPEYDNNEDPTVFTRTEPDRTSMELAPTTPSGKSLLQRIWRYCRSMQPRLERLYQQYKTGDKNVLKRLGQSGQTLMRISIICVISVCRNEKSPLKWVGFFLNWEPRSRRGRCSTLTWGQRTVSSKQTVLLAPFGAASPLAKTGGPLRERTTAK